MNKTAQIEEFYSKKQQFQKELQLLRQILSDTELEETLKWGMPTYTFNGKNVAGVAGFKAYFCLFFFQGALLSDLENKLVNAQEGKTHAMRQWRFDSVDDIDEQLIRSYVVEAITNEKEGLRILPQKPIKQTPEIPLELKKALASNPTLSTAFEDLTPGRQKEYGEYIASPKRAATKQSRLAKITPMILKGVGLNDHYK